MEYGRLWAQRKLRGWSQEDLVRRLIDAGIELGERQLGVTRSQISRWERGVTHPRAPYPKLLCRVFELSAEELGLFEAPLFDGNYSGAKSCLLLRTRAQRAQIHHWARAVV